MRALLVIILLYFYVSPTLQDTINATIAPPIIRPINHPKLGANNRIKLGVLGISGQQLDAIHAAAAYMNNMLDVLNDTAIDLYSYTSAVESDVLFSAMYFSYNLKVNGMIGASTSSLSKTGQTIAKINQIPQIASNAIAGSLSNKLDYPYFTRTISADVEQVGAVLDLFEKYGWKRGVVIYTSDEYGLGHSQLLLQGSARGISFYATGISANIFTAAAFIPHAETLKAHAEAEGYRIFVVWGTTAANSALQAYNMTGLLGTDNTTWIITGNLVDALRISTNALLRTGKLDGCIGFGYGLAGGAVYDSALDFWNNRTNITKYTGVQLPPWYYFDSVLAFGYAFDSLLKQGQPFSNITGPVLLDRLKTQVFEGTTGRVVTDSNGDRLGVYEMWNFRNVTASYVGQYSLLNRNLTQYEEVVFQKGSLKAPRDRPYVCATCVHGTCVEDVGCVCNFGFQGSACDVEIKDNDGGLSIVVWLPPALAVIALIFLGGYLWYRRSRRMLVKQVAEKQKSIIERSDLTLTTRIGRGASGEVWKGAFRGTEVAVKKIITSFVDNALIEAFEMEVAMMCGLRHPNIILFMGSCFDRTENEMLLVMEFMARGSLNDVLNNNKIPLSHEMKLHLATQAAQGMNFLHQSNPPTIHHDLKSHNILLDDKWNARISDFGIAKFKEDSKKASEKSNSIGTIYWSAPEVLEGKLSTEKCDCYSFGIVLWEIWHRQMPFAGRDPVAVAIEVIRSGLRPPIAPEIPQEITDLIKSCWAQNAGERPSFQEIMTTLRGMSIISPLQDYAGSTRVDAPTGQVYLISTNVLGAYSLWDVLPREMETAMQLHNQTIRNNIDTFHGYEVSFIKHSFTAAFSTLDDACNFAIAVQVALLHMEWPAALLEQPICAPVYGEPNNALLWNGLRVRIGITCGVPNCEIDAQTGRMSYFGPVVDKLKKLVNAPVASTIVINETVAEQLNKKRPRLIQEVSTAQISDVSGEQVYKFTISSLLGRSSSFKGDVRGNDAVLPHVVVAINQPDDDLMDDDIIALPNLDRPVSATAINAQLNKTVPWIADNTDIEIKDVLGKGHIGDYYRGKWNGKEVAVKILVNQKLKELDVFKLLGDSSFMYKLYNPNLLPLYGVCVDPDHITILSEYMAKGNLKLVLADNSIQLNYQRKVSIALSIAQGMAYLSSLPDPCMQMHDNLKSNNILLGKNWEVKIADYGHSNIRELARTMTSVGNIAWTAPEILGGEPMTPKIAIYSFGIILWELYTRQVPYSNEHPIKVVTRILGGYRPPMPNDCPPSFKSLFDSCVSQSPSDRPDWASIIQSLSSL